MVCIHHKLSRCKYEKHRKRNVELAKKLFLPSDDMEKVVNLPMDQFVNFALEKQFSEKQMEMLREMR